MNNKNTLRNNNKSNKKRKRKTIQDSRKPKFKERIYRNRKARKINDII